MKLTLDGITNTAEYTKAGIALPQFDTAAMRRETAENPEWVHFGAGNIFRGFIGSIAQELLNKGLMKTGITAVESFDFDIIDKIYVPHDNLTLNVTTDKSGNLKKEVLAGIADAVKGCECDRLFEIAKKPSLKMISFTITEKGYAVTGLDGELIGIVKSDIENGIDYPKHTMSIIAAMLYKRFKAINKGIAIVSMDNCSHNGEKLKNGVMTVAKAWAESGTVEKDFIDYLDNAVSFPWSMIDKITPRPDNSIKEELENLGVSDMAPVITDRNTYIAPFVNAETPQYLVIEDDFPAGRPPFEAAGVYMTTRETVNKAETMKVTTCLNPLHTGLAVFGCLLGYNTIWEEMRDSELVKLVHAIADEGMKVVINPEIINPVDFVNEVINERLPNPYIPDAPQRIATDTSQKIPVRYGETIKSYMKSDTLDAASLDAIPLVIAGWLRYVMAVDDNGVAFTPSPDPMLEDIRQALSTIKLGEPQTADGVLDSILVNPILFGTDLCAAGLSGKIERLFKSMISGKGAVRNTLKTNL